MAPVSRAIFWDKNGCKHTYVSPKTWEMVAGFDDANEIECPNPEDKGKALGDKYGGTLAPNVHAEKLALKRLEKDGNARIAPAGEVLDEVRDAQKDLAKHDV